MILRTGTAALLAAAIGGLIGSSNIATAHELAAPCEAELAAVESAITDATFIGKNASADEASLLAKLTSAEAKLAEGKTTDAIAKLEDISTTADALAGASKPKLESASNIDAAVDQAIACLSVM